MKGSYVLLVELKENSKIRIGKLGVIDFPRGYYCYVGSALGRSVNLENRLKRHFRKEKKIKWHIDYLLADPNVSIDGAIIFPSRKRKECFLSRIIEERAKTIKNFGSSDCDCKGHLHYFRRKEELLSVLNKELE
jgi:Uri superfamily endonuclease